jgi:hypothetical protein
MGMKMKEQATRKERWVFADSELPITDFDVIKADDEFVTGPLLMPDGSYTELGVIVYRNGEISNRWSDGVAGVPEDVVESAKTEEEYYALDEFSTEVDTWKDVICGPNGEFIRFAN